MIIFDKKLTNKSLLILETIMDAVETKQEVLDIIIACNQAKITRYATNDGMSERFGSRVKKSETVSFVFQIINGLAKENEELRSELNRLKKADEK